MPFTEDFLNKICLNFTLIKIALQCPLFSPMDCSFLSLSNRTMQFQKFVGSSKFSFGLRSEVEDGKAQTLTQGLVI